MDELHFYKNLSDPAAVPGYHTGPIGCLRLAGPETVVAYGAWAESNTRCDSLSGGGQNSLETADESHPDTNS